MSAAVPRSSPTKAQDYLDNVLREMVIETGNPDDKTSLNKILFYCMKQDPASLRQIDGATGEVITNMDMLVKSSQVAQSLHRSGVKQGKVAIIVGGNHINFSIVYYGCLFAGVTLFPLDPRVTEYELIHFTKVSNPSILFVSKERVEMAENALKVTKTEAEVVSYVEPDANISVLSLDTFISGNTLDIEKYRPADMRPDDVIIYIPTSGSTGLPKAAMLTNGGAVLQLPTIWASHKRFPSPEDLCLILSTGQWITHSLAMANTVAFGMPLLMTSAVPTPAHVLDLFKRYKPSWALLSPAVATSIVKASGYNSGDLLSLRTLLLTGSSVPAKLLHDLKTELRPEGRLCNGYGLTEAHGFVTIPDDTSPLESVGKVANIFDYKIINEQGDCVKPFCNGELYLKSPFCMTSAYANDDTPQDCFTKDGWYKTGDIFYEDEKENLFFVERTKLSFKYQNHQVSPTEIENVICSVGGVEAAAVCGVDQGPAALVVRSQGCRLTEMNIHDVVRAKLSDPKQLRGGIVFVPTLPHTRNGKIDRTRVRALILEALHEKQNYKPVN